MVIQGSWKPKSKIQSLLVHQNFPLQATKSVQGPLTTADYVIPPHKITLPEQKIAGRLRHFLGNWKIIGVQTRTQEILTRGWCSMLELSALLGRLNQTARIGIWEAPLHYTELFNECSLQPCTEKVTSDD